MRNASVAKHPIHSIRIGQIEASIWFNQTIAGNRHNVTVTSFYRDDYLWRESQRFGRDDLLLLAKVIDHTHSWIVQSGAAAADTE